MSVSLRENLLGYLLGALDHDEHLQVEQAIDRDPQLRAELAKLASLLPDVDADRQLEDPPIGLAARTCQWIAVQLDDEAEESLDCLEPPANRVSAEIADQPGNPERHAPSTMHPITLREAAGSSRWSFADLFVAAGIVVAASFLFLPALAHSRFAAQRQVCQNNLRQVGMALFNYSDKFGGYFPPIPESGNRSFVGVVGTTLVDGQFLNNVNTLLCPASQTVASTIGAYPTLREIDLATPSDLPALMARARSDYGFNVGWISSNNRYQVPLNRHRTSYGLLADAPSAGDMKSRTDHHGGRGQNVFFEDGHCAYIKGCSDNKCPDPIFFNRAGQVALGLDEDDTVIARPEMPLRLLRTVSR